MSLRTEVPYVCPNCPSHKKNKCSLNTLKGVWHCFRCDASGHVDGLSAQIVLKGAEELLRQQDGQHQQQTPACPDCFPLTEFARKYLLGRGISEYLMRWLPIYSTPGGILFRFLEDTYWQKRSWFDSGPRWIGPMSPKASEGVVYHLRSRRSDQVVLVEGIGDALKVSSAGYSVAAMLSKRFYPAQLRRLSEQYDRAVVMLDADVSLGQVLRTMNLTHEFFPDTDLVQLAGSGWPDPGDMPVDQIARVLQ